MCLQILEAARSTGVVFERFEKVLQINCDSIDDDDDERENDKNITRSLLYKLHGELCGHTRRFGHCATLEDTRAH